MMYKYYFKAIQCHKWYSNFMRACDLGIDDAGISVEISFVTDQKPTKENKEKIIKILEKTKEEKSLETCFVNVKFIRCEVLEV